MRSGLVLQSAIDVLFVSLVTIVYLSIFRPLHLVDLLASHEFAPKFKTKAIRMNKKEKPENEELEFEYSN